MKAKLQDVRETLSFSEQPKNSQAHQSLLDLGFLNPDNWIYHDDIVTNVLAGSYDKIDPYCSEFVTTLNCSNRCGFCGYESAKRKEESWLSNNTKNPRCQMPDTEHAIYLLDKLIDGGVQGIIFTGGGEPFIFSGLEKLVAHATSRKIDTVVYTNGNASSQIRLHRLIEASPLLVRVSLNAGTKQVYNSMHNPLNSGNAFKRVLSTIKTLAIGSSQNPKMDFGVGILINEKNQDDLVESAKRIREIKESTNGRISFVSYRPAFKYYAISQLQPFLLDKTYDIVEQQVRPILENAGIALNNIECRYEALKHNTRDYTICRASGLYGELSPPGELHLCCERNCDREYIIGDLRKDSLREIYTSERRHAALNWISASECSSCFVACKPHETNRMFEKIEQMRASGRINEVESWIHEQRSKPAPKMVNF